MGVVKMNWQEVYFNSLSEHQKRNRLFKQLQICLWLGEKRFLGPVKLLYREVRTPQTFYDLWNVESLMTGELTQVSTDRLGKQLTEMEAIAWAATCRGVE